MHSAARALAGTALLAAGACLAGTLAAANDPANAVSIAQPANMATVAPCPRPARGIRFQTPATHARTVALTFDDGPSRYTPQVLAVLAKYHVHGTFFETGLHVNADPTMAKSVVEAGNKIGNHTYTHPQAVPGSHPYGSFDTLSKAIQVAQIDNTTKAIAKATGTRPCFFRAPGGHDNSALTRSIVRNRQMTLAYWSPSTGDSSQPGRRTAAAVNRIVHSATTSPGSHPIILMHDGKASAEPERQVSSYRGNTVAALPRIIRWYKAHSYVFTDPAGRTFN
jgi:peptidoglycan/xylan/chitin deacetylase (PgdA/CDA1 family)